MITGKLLPLYEQNLRDVAALEAIAGGSVDAAFVLTALQGFLRDGVTVTLERDDGQVVLSVKYGTSTARVVGESLTHALAQILSWKQAGDDPDTEIAPL